MDLEAETSRAELSRDSLEQDEQSINAKKSFSARSRILKHMLLSNCDAPEKGFSQSRKKLSSQS